ncbi:hypothetical protein [Streptomyces atroolivaceus]|uniref:hypothetical protein n=1 Tax=Streptomyces atroolivaceus TaxID=66869 RepID=UPI002025964F|nr:hypothetical protein [Streptomyces atroolivaceus]
MTGTGRRPWRRDQIHAFTIGMDTEPHGPLPTGVSRPSRCRGSGNGYASWGPEPGVVLERLFFSAEESVFKFEEEEIMMKHEKGASSARPTLAGPVVEGKEWRGFSGRRLVRNGLLVGAATPPNTSVRTGRREMVGTT